MTSTEELETKIKPKQAKFVRELLRNGGNATEAAIAAGYAPGSAAATASRMLKDANVAAYKRACAQEIYDSLGISTEQIGLHIYDIFQRCMQATPHLVWDSEAHDYVPDGSWQFDAKGATKALELLAKMGNYYREKVEVSGSIEAMPVLSMAEKQQRLQELLDMQRAGSGGY